MVRPPPSSEAGDRSSNLPSDRSIAHTAGLNLRFVERLRAYQKEAVLWMHALLSCGLGCLLADDMGLGKTVQALAMVASSLLGADAAGGAGARAQASASEGEGQPSTKFSSSSKVPPGSELASASACGTGSRALIVCPASVVHHWVHECEKFFPSSSDSGRGLVAVAYTGGPKGR